MRTGTLVAAFLVAIVLANFAVTYFGVVASITTAFFLIGLDIALEFTAKASGGFVWSLLLRKRAFQPDEVEIEPIEAEQAEATV